MAREVQSWLEGCERLMRESEKLILTSLWAGRLRKIREIKRRQERWRDNFYCMPWRERSLNG